MMNETNSSKATETATPDEMAERIAAALRDGDFGARVWEGGGHVRVYVTRELSRGRRQDMGYIDCSDVSDLHYYVTRQASAIRAIVASV